MAVYIGSHPFYLIHDHSLVWVGGDRLTIEYHQERSRRSGMTREHVSSALSNADRIGMFTCVEVLRHDVQTL